MRALWWWTQLDVQQQGYQKPKAESVVLTVKMIPKAGFGDLTVMRTLGVGSVMATGMLKQEVVFGELTVMMTLEVGFGLLAEMLKGVAEFGLQIVKMS